MKKAVLVFLAFVLAFISFFSLGSAPKQEKIVWGVNFSQKQSKDLSLDWKKVYSALIDDLGAKEIKLAVYWDLIEPQEGEYDFNDLDWQIEKAEASGAKLLLAIGRKVPRWPECHEPNWAKNLEKKEEQEKILNLLEEIVSRYKDNPAVWAWQVENEPFFPFGECSWVDKDFFKKEIALVKSLDSARPVIVSDSGEGSFWIQAAQLGDIVGTTMYKKVWVRQLEIYFTHPFQPVFYWRKAQIVKKIFGKEVIGVELQAEPWGPKLLSESTLAEQEKTMNLEQFRKNLEFAKKSGLDRFYFWGAEWWYWMKTKHNQPEIWNEAAQLF